MKIKIIKSLESRLMIEAMERVKGSDLFISTKLKVNFYVSIKLRGLGVEINSRPNYEARRV